MMIMTVEFAVILVANKSRMKSAASENDSNGLEDQNANTWKTLFKNMVTILVFHITNFFQNKYFWIILKSF